MTYLPTKAEKGISNLISVIFHPLLFPSYLFLALFSMNHYFSLSVPLMAKLLILAMVFTISLILPLLFFLLFKHFRIIESLEMKKREERIYPLITVSLMYFLLFYLMKSMQLSSIYQLTILGCTSLSILALLVNLRTKISLHSLAAGGTLGGMIALKVFFSLNFAVWIIPLIIMISAFIISSRLIKKAHNEFEVYSGFLTGFFLMLFLFISAGNT